MASEEELEELQEMVDELLNSDGTDGQATQGMHPVQGKTDSGILRTTALVGEYVSTHIFGHFSRVVFKWFFLSGVVQVLA